MKDFIPPNEALELKQLSFDEPCFGYYDDEDIEQQVYEYANCSDNVTGGKACYHEGFLSVTNSQLDEYGSFGAKDDEGLECYERWTAPTFSQSFRFFREKYGLHQYVEYIKTANRYDWWVGHTFNNTKTYEEAELECLRKLIEIVKQKQ